MNQLGLGGLPLSVAFHVLYYLPEHQFHFLWVFVLRHHAEDKLALVPFVMQGLGLGKKVLDGATASFEGWRSLYKSGAMRYHHGGDLLKAAIKRAKVPYLRMLEVEGNTVTFAHSTEVKQFAALANRWHDSSFTVVFELPVFYARECLKIFQKHPVRGARLCFHVVGYENCLDVDVPRQMRTPQKPFKRTYDEFKITNCEFRAMDEKFKKVLVPAYTKRLEIAYVDHPHHGPGWMD